MMDRAATYVCFLDSPLVAVPPPFRCYRARGTKNRSVAQWLEQQVERLWVANSIPVRRQERGGPPLIARVQKGPEDHSSTSRGASNPLGMDKGHCESGDRNTTIPSLDDRESSLGPPISRGVYGVPTLAPEMTWRGCIGMRVPYIVAVVERCPPGRLPCTAAPRTCPQDTPPSCTELCIVPECSFSLWHRWPALWPWDGRLPSGYQSRPWAQGTPSALLMRRWASAISLLPKHATTPSGTERTSPACNGSNPQSLRMTPPTGLEDSMNSSGTSQRHQTRRMQVPLHPISSPSPELLLP